MGCPSTPGPSTPAPVSPRVPGVPASEASQQLGARPPRGPSGSSLSLRSPQCLSLSGSHWGDRRASWCRWPSPPAHRCTQPVDCPCVCFRRLRGRCVSCTAGVWHMGPSSCRAHQHVPAVQGARAGKLSPAGPRAGPADAGTRTRERTSRWKDRGSRRCGSQSCLGRGGTGPGIWDQPESIWHLGEKSFCPRRVPDRWCRPAPLQRLAPCP